MKLYNTETREVVQCEKLPDGWKPFWTIILFKQLNDEVDSNCLEDFIKNNNVEDIAEYFNKIKEDNKELGDKFLVNIWPAANKCKCLSCPTNELWIGQKFSDYLKAKGNENVTST